MSLLATVGWPLIWMLCKLDFGMTDVLDKKLDDILANHTYQDIRRDLLLHLYRDTINQKTTGHGNGFHLRRKTKYPMVFMSMGCFAEGMARQYYNTIFPQDHNVGPWVEIVRSYVEEETQRLAQEQINHDTFLRRGIIENTDLDRLQEKEFFQSGQRGLWQSLLVCVTIESSVRALGESGILDDLEIVQKVSFASNNGFSARFTTKGFQIAREIQTMSCL